MTSILTSIMTLTSNLEVKNLKQSELIQNSSQDPEILYGSRYRYFLPRSDHDFDFSQKLDLSLGTRTAGPLSHLTCLSQMRGIRISSNCLVHRKNFEKKIVLKAGQLDYYILYPRKPNLLKQSQPNGIYFLLTTSISYEAIISSNFDRVMAILVHNPLPMPPKPPPVTTLTSLYFKYFVKRYLHAKFQTSSSKIHRDMGILVSG